MNLSLASVLLAIGAFTPWLLPNLLSPMQIAPLCLSLLVLPRPWRIAIGALLFGAVWGAIDAHRFADAMVPVGASGVDLRVTGYLRSHPEFLPEQQRFDLQLESISAGQWRGQPETFRLSWYRADQQLNQGDYVDATVRVRRPRGLANPGFFDYERWLVGKGYSGTGYVRQMHDLQRGKGSRDFVEQMRERYSHWLQGRSFLEYSEILSALGLGDQSAIERGHWDLFMRTGVIHLMVVSGLHIGFAGALGYSLGCVIGKPLVAIRRRGCHLDIARIFALLAAITYALLSGFGLPAQRALCMLTLLLLASWMRLRWSGWTVLGFALAAVALLKPSVVLEDTFWMSFGAVTVLVVYLSGRPRTNWISGLLSAQVAILLCFGALALVLGKPVYPVGFLVNLVAVPVAGILLIPPLLLGLLLVDIWPLAAESLVRIADRTTAGLMVWFAWTDALSIGAIDHQFRPLHWRLALLLVGLLFLLVPHAFFRAITIPGLILLALAAEPEKPELQLRMVDAGQGTAVLIQQPGFNFLYDTGPGFGDRFNLGRDVLAPLLNAAGNRLDGLILSHDHQDHIGGAAAILDQVPIDIFIAGGTRYADRGAQPCHSGQEFQRGAVRYQILYPFEDAPRPIGVNDQSCVLLVSFGGTQILLVGDIESFGERHILLRYPDLADVDLLLVPHHGSGTSSSARFVEQIRPAHALISSGYGNSFGHPALGVLERYQAVGSRIWVTAQTGQVDFRWYQLADQPVISIARRGWLPWWKHRPQRLE